MKKRELPENITYKSKHTKLPWKDKMCESHNPMNKELGYLQWHSWAQRMTNAKERQIQCVRCGYWLFMCEM